MPTEVKENNDVPIPNWLVKGNSVHFPNGNMVTFKGKRDADFYIIFKDKEDKFHVNFTITKGKYGLHTKDEKTGERTFLLDIYSDVIIDLVNHWKKLKPHWVNDFPATLWENKEDAVIDVNTTDVPNLKWKNGIYDIEPEDVMPYSLSKNEIIELKFSQGLIYSKLGICKGMLMPHKKSKKLIRIDRALTEIVFNTAIGIDVLKQEVMDEYSHYKNSTSN